MSQASIDAVVVAAGSSTRMAGVDKLMAPLSGRPLLAWTLEAFAASAVRRIVLVVAPPRVRELGAQSWVRQHDAEVVAGGERRQVSVAHGLAVTDAEVVLVHDGARPLVTPSLVRAVAQEAERIGAAIPVLPVADTLKRLDGELVGATVDRQGLGGAQTPQGLRRDVLESVLARLDLAGPVDYTDEAALVEAVGLPVAAVAGEATNVKVTRPADLALAEAILTARLGPPRTGIGRDSHPFGPADGLALGGIEISDAPRLRGHSDGDAALHAVADAILGAAGLGDLGRRFPAGDEATAGAPSADFVRQVVRDAAAVGLRPASLDLTIVAARPRLGPARLDAMRDVIAGLLGLEPGQVSVKASSGNLDGPEGEGRSISALAVASLVRAWSSR